MAMVDIPPTSCLANTKKILFIFTYVISSLHIKLGGLNNLNYYLIILLLVFNYFNFL